MNKYDLIFEAVQESLDSGEITLEESIILNDYAYEKYIEEKTALQKRYPDIKHKPRPANEKEGGKYLNLQKEKNRFNELVKKYNYDPKTKTIEIDGVRTPIKYDYHNRDTAYFGGNAKSRSQKKSKMKALNKISSKDARNREKKKINVNYYKGIIISKDVLDDFDFAVNHENQHAKDASLQRMMDREPRFDTKYGTSGLDKDTRRKLLEVKKEYREYMKSHKGRANPFTIDRFENQIEELLDKSKKKTKEYKTDKNEKRKDKRKEFSKKVREYLDSPNNKKLKDNMNSHDNDDMEFYADLGAMKHGKNKEYSMKMQRGLEKRMPKTQKDHKTNVARRESRNELKKQGLLNYVEKFND